jgi:hypothetical protein
MGRNKTLQIFRGTEANLPALQPGEPAITLDTKKLFIGTDGTKAGNVNIGSIDSSQIGTANGLASLDTNGKLTGTQAPDLSVLGLGYGTCGTGAGTAAKVGVLSGFVLKVGSQVALKFTNADTSTNPTLNINGTGAKPIFYNGARITSDMIPPGWLGEFVYDGINWNLLNPANAGTGSGIAPYIVRITFDSSLAGQSFTISGPSFTYTNTVPSSLTFDVEVPTGATSYIVVCGSAEAAVDVEGAYGVYPVTVNALPTDLHDMTWAQLGDISNAIKGGANPADYFNRGDEIDVQLTSGEVLTLQIYDFNHDDLADGTGKAPITFGLKHLMAATRVMNSTNTNVGGFTGSEMYTWLQGDLYNSLPTGLKSIIKSVNKKTSAGNTSATINTNAMKMFLFSEVELFGTTTYSVAGEGTQYPIFTDNASRIKKLSNGAGSANSWWERSPYASNATSFCFVYSVGSAIGASTAYGVCFGFCI